MPSDTRRGCGAVAEARAALRAKDEAAATTEALYRMGGRLAAELDVHKLVQMVTDEATSLRAVFTSVYTRSGG